MLKRMSRRKSRMTHKKEMMEEKEGKSGWSFHKLLTAEGWRRLMRGRSSKAR